MKHEDWYDELWYRRLIAKAIIFRGLETEVPKQHWYQGGYRANIVTYAMAKVFHDSNRGNEVLDLDTVSRKQIVPEALLQALLVAAAAAQDVITHPVSGMRNMSEWAKQQACWNALQSRTLIYGDSFESCLTLVESARASERDERRKKREIDGISAQAEVVKLGASFWRELLAQGVSEQKVSPKDQQILQVCASIPSKIPSELQCKHALSVLERLRQT